jgi:hypothetical protein
MKAEASSIFLFAFLCANNKINQKILLDRVNKTRKRRREKRPRDCGMAWNTFVQ